MNSPQTLVFSGVQPTGELHLGNYLGVIRRFAELQKSYKCMYCIADLHAITNGMFLDDLHDKIRLVAATFLAIGIDPKKQIIFKQSSVPQHSELAWIFNCIVSMGWMNRMTQFKDKAGINSEKISLGLYAYPTLMAADILLYGTTLVPVGDDQKQHIELTRNIAQKFNSEFADRIEKLGHDAKIELDGQLVPFAFPIVEGLIDNSAPRIMSLRNASKKMSKSDVSDLSRINLLDNADSVAKKIQKAKTDSDVLPFQIEELTTRPEANNLVGILASLERKEKKDILKVFGGQPFSKFKPTLIDAIVSEITPISTEIRRYLRDPSYVDHILHEGAIHARSRAQKTMDCVHKIIGLSPAKNRSQ
ncbi:tryptophan--tRNA ligase [Candidatus Liberibacter sp.]|uniref:tryptophan--tRNA ligase n=1 Tax=Candidatus Liberibacter sp. TaxID=34022 RepID=UPI0015F6297A|nr:tryptophan--tRNA ligase [Candidatus Liberibacter sp.]MBA5724266.1 tryptophan--tRNA ligase [Candidatus Liberibacter sp.]